MNCVFCNYPLSDKQPLYSLQISTTMNGAIIEHEIEHAHGQCLDVAMRYIRDAVAKTKDEMSTMAVILGK